LVGIPRECSSARASPWLLVGHARGCLRIVDRLRLPGDDPVADVDHPRARPRAVHTMCGADLAIMTPAFAIELLGTAAAVPRDGAAVVARCTQRQVAQAGKQGS